jgi:hypothetical protein
VASSVSRHEEDHQSSINMSKHQEKNHGKDCSFKIFMEIIGRKKAIGTATLFPTSSDSTMRKLPSAPSLPPPAFLPSVSIDIHGIQRNQINKPSPKEKASFSMKIICYQWTSMEHICVIYEDNVLSNFKFK